jgi:hypothetical protein
MAASDSADSELGPQGAYGLSSGDSSDEELGPHGCQQLLDDLQLAPSPADVVVGPIVEVVTPYVKTRNTPKLCEWLLPRTQLERDLVLALSEGRQRCSTAVQGTLNIIDLTLGDYPRSSVPKCAEAAACDMDPKTFGERIRQAAAAVRIGGRMMASTAFSHLRSAVANGFHMLQFVACARP